MITTRPAPYCSGGGPETISRTIFRLNFCNSRSFSCLVLACPNMPLTAGQAVHREFVLLSLGFQLPPIPSLPSSLSLPIIQPPIPSPNLRSLHHSAHIFIPFHPPPSPPSSDPAFWTCHPSLVLFPPSPLLAPLSQHPPSPHPPTQPESGPPTLWWAKNVLTILYPIFVYNFLLMFFYDICIEKIVNKNCRQNRRQNRRQKS